jgi:hypothetical protein
MSQQSAEDAIGQSGNTEDRPWVFSQDTRLVVHQTCACCDRYSDHYRETGMYANSPSFQAACRAERSKICEPLRSTLGELKTLHTNWEVANDNLREETRETKEELEAIKQETDKSSQEFERLSRELEEVREETASIRREGGLVDETRTPRAQPVHINIIDSDIKIISPPS